MVREAARDGYHQLGGAAMGLDAGEGVVDAECRTFGLDNLWIASSSVFPSGGQANPTLTIVALACRVADRVAKRRAAAA
jgi:choline dehydrogenase-like flavoprotein